MIARVCTADCIFLINSVIAKSGFGEGESPDLAAVLAGFDPDTVLVAGGVFAFSWATGGKVSANAGPRETVQISTKENRNMTSRIRSKRPGGFPGFIVF